MRHVLPITLQTRENRKKRHVPPLILETRENGLIRHVVPVTVQTRYTNQSQYRSFFLSFP
jgi:hypothetical protein